MPNYLQFQGLSIQKVISLFSLEAWIRTFEARSHACWTELPNPKHLFGFLPHEYWIWFSGSLVWESTEEFGWETIVSQWKQVNFEKNHPGFPFTLNKKWRERETTLNREKVLVTISLSPSCGPSSSFVKFTCSPQASVLKPSHPQFGRPPLKLEASTKPISRWKYSERCSRQGQPLCNCEIDPFKKISTTLHNSVRDSGWLKLVKASKSEDQHTSLVLWYNGIFLFSIKRKRTKAATGNDN